MKSFYTLFILAFLTTTVSLAQEKCVIVGSGGGIAGTATVYKITTAGKVLKGSGIEEIKYTESGKIKKGKAKKYIQMASEQTQLNSQFNHPGNLYYFIRYTEGTTDRKVTWGDPAHPIPESMQKLYQEINTALGAARFKSIP